jgi:hypothetical protein
MTLQDGFEIAVFVGWTGCLLSLFGVARHSSLEFRSIGRSRGRWFLISVLGAVPYLGILTALAYFFRCSLDFPEKPKTAPRPRPSGQPQQYGQNRTGYQAPAAQPIQRPRCTRCNGGKVPCHCSGGRVVINGELVPDFACSGSGQVNCPSCGGSGIQPYV